MELKISELRLLLNSFSMDFSKFLSDSEINKFHEIADSSGSSVLLSDGVEIDSFLVNSQQVLYDRLSLFIKLLQELDKNRPLPF